MSALHRVLALGTIAALTLGGAKETIAADPTGEIVGTITASVAKHRANTVIYVKNAGLGVSTATVKMDQKGLVFSPRVLPIQKGTTVEFINSDPVGHNVFTPDGDKYDLGTWPKGDSRKHKFETTGVFRQLCKVHDDMVAFIVVVDSKYFTVSEKTGDFKLPQLPPGKYTLAVWNEKLGAKEVTVDVTAGKATKIDFALDKK
jgi:plastocyanin